MYRIDIACTRWKSFTVYTPKFYDVYAVDYIGKDKRLWDYVVIRHWTTKLLYAHTKTDLNVWDKLWKNSIVWKINKSWISTWYHLHLELWKWNDNVTLQYLYWSEYKTNPKSWNLRVQRWLVSDKEINQIILWAVAKFEGLRLTSYLDGPHWRYSIGYGTKSYKWEVITKAEADKRARTVIQNIRKKYWLNEYTIDVQKAVVSFVYNIGSINSKQQRLLKNWNYCALGNSFTEYNKMTINWEKKIAWWLVKRRAFERSLLCN